MIYLVGCNHDRHQRFFPAHGLRPGHEAFKAFIKGTVFKYNISLIAEELSDPKEPDLENPNRIPRSSVALHLINELRAIRCIEHRYCEPCSRDKNRLGIGGGFPFIQEPCNRDFSSLIRNKREAHLHDIAHRWPIREKFWIERLVDGLDREVLFICGALHRCTFGSRLHAAGAETRVLDRFFEHEVGLCRSDICKEEFEAYREVRLHRFQTEDECPCISLPNRRQSL